MTSWGDTIPGMDKLILAIDAELRKLTSARALLSENGKAQQKPTESKRSIAQRKRWAKVKRGTK